MPLVTLSMANDHLRLNLQNDGASPPTFTDPRVDLVTMKTTQAEAIVLDYLKLDVAHDPTDSPQVWTSTDVIVVQAAILKILSALYDDAQGKTIEDYMKPGGAVPLLLARLRDPALA